MKCQFAGKMQIICHFKNHPFWHFDSPGPPHLAHQASSLSSGLCWLTRHISKMGTPDFDDSHDSILVLL